MVKYAFPVPVSRGQYSTYHSNYKGMTLKDYIAIEAMKVLSNRYGASPRELAEQSYMVATAMMIEAGYEDEEE